MVDQPRSKGGFNLGDYVEVKDRIKLFLAQYPDGRLVTDRVEMWLDDGVPRVVVKALAYRDKDDPLPGVGWSWMQLPGTTTYTRGSELENTETSAWGRAIGSLGIGIEKSIASANEVQSKSGAAAGDRIENGTSDGSLIGLVVAGKPPCDLQLRQTPDGPIAGFKLAQGRSGLQVLASGNLAHALQPFLEGIVDVRVSVWGHVEMVPWDKDGKPMPPYKRLMLSKIRTPDWELPGNVPTAQTSAGPENEPDTAPLFPDEDEAAAILAAEMAEANA